MRKSLHKSTLLVTLGLAVMTASTATMADEVLTGAEIKKLFPGTHSLSVFGFHIRILASASGNVTVSLGEEADSGLWFVRGDQLCLSLKQLTKGEAGCSKVEYDGKTRLRVQGITFSVN